MARIRKPVLDGCTGKAGTPPLGGAAKSVPWHP
jgi:hypothetical protein